MDAATHEGRIRIGWGFRCLARPRTLAVVALLGVIEAVAIVTRVHFSSFLETFEDPYQNWWISANLVQTGQYWDRFSMMTHGNWLPFYHFFGAAVLLLTGLRNMEALRLANIALSGLTGVLVVYLGRRHSLSVAVAAFAFFGLNFIDIAVSGEATAEPLATFLFVLGYIGLFVPPRESRFWWGVAGVSFALAAMTRYEVWLAVVLLVGYAFLGRHDTIPRRRVLIVILPSFLFMVGYFIYASQWGFLPAIVVQQTSTDIRFQLSAGTEPSPFQILVTWWSSYVAFFPLVLLLGGAYALWRFRREYSAWVILSLWGFTVVYAVLRFGNPSFRYIMLTLPFLSVFSAVELERLVRRMAAARPALFHARRGLVPAAAIVGVVVIAATMLPGPATYWSGFPSSRNTEPLVRAGEFLSHLTLPPGKILISESPVAAYYSGFPPDRILGSHYLPDNRTAALAFLDQNVAYVVYVGVPYYPLRTLFPELQNGTSTPDFALLYDAGGLQESYHVVYVYEVVG